MNIQAERSTYYQALILSAGFRGPGVTFIAADWATVYEPMRAHHDDDLVMYGTENVAPIASVKP
jgi:hypothetical protein